MACNILIHRFFKCRNIVCKPLILFCLIWVLTSISFAQESAIILPDDYDTVKINTIVKELESDIYNEPEVFIKEAKKIIKQLERTGNYGKVLSKSKNFEYHALLISARMHHRIGLAHEYLNQLFQAKRNYYHSLIILESIDRNFKNQKDAMFFLIKSNNYNNLGILEQDHQNMDKALTLYNTALELTKQSGYVSYEIRTLNNLGTLYFEMEDYPKSIVYLEDALIKLGSIKDQSMMPKILNNLAANYIELGEYAKAVEYTEKALEIDKMAANRMGISVKLGNLGYIHTRLKNYAIAKGYLTEAKTISDSLGSLELKSDHARFLYELSELSGDYKSALSYYKKHIIFKDSILDVASIKEFAQIESDFEIQKSKIESDAQAQIAEAEIQSEKNKRIYLTLISLLLLFLVVVLYILFRINKTRKILLEVENEQIRRELELLLDKQDEEPKHLQEKIEKLNARQKEVLELLRAGKSNGEIADSLFISVNTVKYHLKIIFDVLEVKHRSNLQ